MIAEANEKAAEILQEAQARAEQLNDEATRQHEQAMAANRAEIDREKQALIVAQNQVADFKKSLFDMYKAHLELISQMPEPDYDASTEPEAPVQTDEEPILEDTPKRDPFATSQFSAKTIRGEYDSRFGDLHFGQKNNNAKDE